VQTQSMPSWRSRRIASSASVSTSSTNNARTVTSSDPVRPGVRATYHLETSMQRLIVA
jgi:hypothetical protein